MRNSVVSFGSVHGRAGTGTGVGSGYGGASSVAGPVIAVGGGSAVGTGIAVSAVGGGSAVGTGAFYGWGYNAGVGAGGTGIAVSTGGGLADFGADVAGQSGQAVTDPITISDLISSGSLEVAAHDKGRGQLLRSVSGLPAYPTVNAINTLNGKKGFNPDDWGKLGAFCKEGDIDLGIINELGQVQGMFTPKGESYIKAKNADGLGYWVGLNALGTTTAVEEASQQDFESPEAIAGRLESIAKEAIIPISGSRLMGTDRAYIAQKLPSVSVNRELRFERPSLYTGVTAFIPASPYRIVGAKLIE
jgi:hypothetical protein